MACLKWFKRLLIPVLAILLMSHNTYAAELQLPVRLRSVYNTTFSSTGSDHSFWGVQYGYGPMESSMFRLNWSNLSCEAGDYLETIVNFFNVTENNSLDSWVSSLYGGDSDFSFISATYENMDSSSGQIKFVIYCNTTFSNANKFLEFGSATGGKLHIYPNEYITVIYTTRYSVVDPNAGTQDIVNAINNHPAPSAAEIGDAVNAPQEQAAENISNQSADDYEMESANMSSLFSQFGNFISAVNGASISDCNIPANFNHIDLGILNLCANPVPDYVQVAVSLVLCMLIAPYLMNIIKRILSIADKIREV